MSKISTLKCVILCHIARIDDYVLLLGTTSRYLSDIAKIYRDLRNNLRLLGGLKLRCCDFRMVLGVLSKSSSAGGPFVESLTRGTAGTRMLTDHLFLLQNCLDLFNIILGLRLIIISEVNLSTGRQNIVWLVHRWCLGRQVLRLVFVGLFRKRSLRALNFLRWPHLLGIIEALIYSGCCTRGFLLLISFFHVGVIGAIFGVSLRLIVSDTILIHFLGSESCSLRRTIIVPVVQLRGTPPSESRHGCFSCRTS